MKVLRFWLLPDSGYETPAALEPRLAAFARVCPGARVEFAVRTAASMWSHLLRLVKNPELQPRPDVVALPSQWTAELARFGLLRDLSKDVPSLDEYHLPLREHSSPPGAGGVFSLPWWMETSVLYHRSDLLARAGVRPESFGGAEGLREACRRLAKPGRPHPLANPGSRGVARWRHVAPFVWSRGGEFFSPDGKRTAFGSDDAFRGMLDYFELFAERWIPLHGPAGLPTAGLREGSCALELSSRLFACRPLRRGTPPVGASAFPASTLLAARHLAVLDGCAYPEEAVRLLRFLCGEAAADYARDIAALPARSADLEAALEGAGPCAEAFRTSLAAARTMPNLPLSGTLGRMLERSLGRMLRTVAAGGFSRDGLKNVLAHAASEMDTVLSLYA